MRWRWCNITIKDDVLWTRGSYQIFARGSHGGDDDDHVRDARDAMKEVRGDSDQMPICEITRREDVNNVCGRLWTGCWEVDNSSCLLTLKILDEAVSQVVWLLKDIHLVSSTGECQEDSVLFQRLHLPCYSFQLRLFQSHPLRNANWSSLSICHGRESGSCNLLVTRDELNLNGCLIVFESQQSSPDNGIPLEDLRVSRGRNLCVGWSLRMAVWLCHSMSRWWWNERDSWSLWAHWGETS